METQTTTISPAGDPFTAGGSATPRECGLCFKGYLTITIEEDDEELFIAIRCRCCNKEE
jgi:hypothetical protein